MRTQPSRACKKRRDPRDASSKVSKIRSNSRKGNTSMIGDRKPHTGRNTRPARSDSVGRAHKAKLEKSVANLIKRENVDDSIETANSGASVRIKREDSPSDVDIEIDKNMGTGTLIKRENVDSDIDVPDCTSPGVIRHSTSDVFKSAADDSESKDSHEETEINRSSSTSSHDKTSTFNTSCTPTEYHWEKSWREETAETTSSYKHTSSKTHKDIANNTPERSQNGTHDSTASNTEESTTSSTKVRTESERRTITIVRDGEYDIVTIRSEHEKTTLDKHSSKTTSRTKTTSKTSTITVIQPYTRTSVTVKRTPGHVVARIHTLAMGRQINEREREHEKENEHEEENEEEHEETETESCEVELKVPVSSKCPQLNELLACMASGCMPERMWQTVMERKLKDWKWESNEDTAQQGRDGPRSEFIEAPRSGFVEEIKEEEDDWF